MSATAIYLSPHYDDVCFSLGITAKAPDRGHLITIFTDCNYTAEPSAPASDIAGIRDAEDRAFAERCLLTRHNLGLPEATVLGLDPFDLNAIQQEVGLLDKPLVHFLMELLEKAEEAETEIYCPMAVGRHRNHLSVFLAVIQSYTALRKRSKIFFYEDLPYASRLASRKEAIERLHTYFPPSHTLRHAHELSPEEMDEKLELIALYPSQHRGPIVPQHFIPAEPLIPSPHEAFWETVP